jgi:hypothetical protein
MPTETSQKINKRCTALVWPIFSQLAREGRLAVVDSPMSSHQKPKHWRQVQSHERVGHGVR